MPELPEVETVLRTLEHKIKDDEILEVRVLYAPIIEGDVEEFTKRLTHEHFRSFHRRGKYLLFYMDNCILVSHLRMEGKYYLQDESEPIGKHIHIIFQLRNGRQLRYCDTRKFGRMSIEAKDSDFDHFRNLGYEPFDERLTPNAFHEQIKGRNVPLKTLLLDQSVIAGIGNIYADEILFACGLRPGRSSKRITRKDEERILNETRRILRAAIEAGGTTIRTYTSSLGVTGRFQLQCQVHEQKRCPVCSSTIKMKRIGGRSSYYCPLCQK